MSKLTAITVEPVEYLYRPMYRDAYVSAFPSDVKWDKVSQLNLQSPLYCLPSCSVRPSPGSMTTNHNTPPSAGR
jgi:hypothetical protein